MKKDRIPTAYEMAENRVRKELEGFSGAFKVRDRLLRAEERHRTQQEVEKRIAEELRLALELFNRNGVTADWKKFKRRLKRINILTGRRPKDVSIL